MNLKLSAAQIEQMKRNAKRAKASEGIPHTAALDAQANLAGYASWSILMKHQGPAPAASVYRFTRSVEEMQEALRPRARAAAQAATPDDILGRLLSMTHAVQHAIDYMTCLLQATNKGVDSSSLAYQEMRAWLPYVTQPVGEGKYLLANRDYDPVGKLASKFSDYQAYPHLHATLSENQLEAIAFRPGERGAAFNDGTTPWGSPALAAAYVARLERFYATFS